MSPFSFLTLCNITSFLTGSIILVVVGSNHQFPGVKESGYSIAQKHRQNIKSFYHRFRELISMRTSMITLVTEKEGNKIL